MGLHDDMIREAMAAHEAKLAEAGKRVYPPQPDVQGKVEQAAENVGKLIERFVKPAPPTRTAKRK